MKEILDFYLRLSQNNNKPINDLYFVCGELYNPTKEVLASVREQTKRDVLAKDFIKNALSYLKRTYKFNEMLNQCFDYAYDPDKE